MRRGEVWTAAGNEPYAGKPRPVVIVQSNAFDGTDSVVICGLTTARDDAPLARPSIEPNSDNGLRARTEVMVDKIFVLPRKRLGARIGSLSREDMARVNQAIIVFLDLAG